MDELTALVRSRGGYRECGVVCLSEAWLHRDIPDSNATITGFETVWTDRNREGSGKEGGKPVKGH